MPAKSTPPRSRRRMASDAPAPRSTCFMRRRSLGREVRSMDDPLGKLPSEPLQPARTNSPPPTWAQDELSKFLQKTHQQQDATFYTKREPTVRCMRIHP